VIIVGILDDIMAEEKKRIVIADDNIELIELVGTILKKIGYVVSYVNNGFELIDYLKNNQETDAVILDLMMPEKGGISVFESIRSISPASKIIIHTGRTDYRNTIYAKEADAFIDKAEGADKIIEVLSELL